jgi:Kef-type K+ transport system membrane component KefB/nucleotide-binding universal stress UspA family protein
MDPARTAPRGKAAGGLTSAARRWALAACAACGLLLSTGGALAADQTTAPSEFILLVDIVVLIAVGRGLGEVMQRLGQPSVMGQLIGGILLGPSVLGALWPQAQHALFPAASEQKAMIDGIAQFGILLLLLLTGMETDLSLARRVGRAAITTSVSGIVIPFACGFALGQFIPDNLLPHPDQRLVASLFLGTALSISSIKIVAVVVREMNFLRRDIGQIIVASAVIDDTIGWIIIAITFSLASQGGPDATSLARSILGTAAFLVASLTVGRRLVFHLIRWANDNFVSEMPVITVILLLMGGMALITHLIGVHTVLGAFVAGILVGESPILTRDVDEQLRGLVSGLFMPVFFGLAGLSADLTVLKDPHLLWLMLGLIATASIGKFAGAFIGGEIGGLSRAQSLALACGMNARGSTEVIVASIGLSIGVLSQELFTMIVAMAVVTTLAMPPMLRAALSRLPMGEEEQARLEREEFEAKGFIANLERLLLAVDDSGNGRFVSRLAGLIAGPRGIPITVLHVGRDADERSKGDDAPQSAETAIKEGASAVKPGEDDKPQTPEVISRAEDKRRRDVVAEEARKGFDLLMIGVGRVAARDGGFHGDVTELAAGFDGPLAVVAGRGEHLRQARQSRLRILVPVTGSEMSRRAAELAVTLARANHSSLSALYVTLGDVGRRPKRPRVINFEQEAVLKDVVALGERYDAPVRTIVRANATPVDAILRELRLGRYDLLVMGINRRPGERLLPGETAGTLLQETKTSILFLAG